VKDPVVVRVLLPVRVVLPVTEPLFVNVVVSVPISGEGSGVGPGATAGPGGYAGSCSSAGVSVFTGGRISPGIPGRTSVSAISEFPQQRCFRPSLCSPRRQGSLLLRQAAGFEPPFCPVCPPLDPLSPGPGKPSSDEQPPIEIPTSNAPTAQIDKPCLGFIWNLPGLNRLFTVEHLPGPEGAPQLYRRWG